MTALAIIKQATVFVGGETGLTIWAPIVQTATVAAYAKWDEWNNHRLDVRPVSFGKPVFHSLVNGPVHDTVSRVAALWSGEGA
jgi:hypothetical protein